ncbi:uncharacterized protein LOC126388927 isoform X2 [Epinephelus moara]|uniref:uncharacterized protein LOC126388927 isoform X2 n=1 Tax=Epinephelus moara TaxID=300413 RepID=UPI00214E306E|nr:uncharacterized protein LOC126388927 isoform X2 [Epinephelus moara]XP_049898279.1 uncharacterized protein LOC126388927 isoform X2 [Epinephelus moara]XP_049898281.1 uncharacterized protein LOC126388927 isoform X2 [Epinephelus moara]
MEPDSSRQQIPDMFEREEMASTTSSEPQLQSPQRSPKKLFLRPRSSKPDKVSHPPPWEEDLQPEDHSCSPAKKIRNNKYIPHQYIDNRLTTKKFYQIDLVKVNLFTYSCFTTLLGYRPSTRDLQSYRWRAFSSIPIQVYPNVMSSSRLLQLLFFGLPVIFKKQASDKTDFFKKIIPHLNLDKESSIDIMPPDEHMKSVIASQEEKQYAFAIAYLKDGNTKDFPAVYPDHPKEEGHSASLPTKKHSEEILIQQIDGFLLDRGNEVKILLVFSYNSPCFKRENNTTCCMFLLLQKADDWHSRYGFFTNVTFTKFWGLTGPNFLKHLTYSDISNLPYIEKCKNIHFKLNEKKLRRNMSENGGLYKKIQQATDKKKLSSTIKSILHKLVDQAKTSCRQKDHLDRGTKIITSSKFHPEVREEIVTALQKKWKEFINDESMSPINKKITTDFNNAVLQLFVKQLKFLGGDNSPLKLYQVPQNMEGEGEYVQQIREL